MNRLEQAARELLVAMRCKSLRVIAQKEAALREALDHSGEANEMVAMNLNCKSVQARLATSWGYVKAEQAEQEPDYFGLTHDHTWLSIDKKQYDKLKPEGRMACYAAPVRTKDLTDDEIDRIACNVSHKEFARAVIAADREKNSHEKTD